MKSLGIFKQKYLLLLLLFFFFNHKVSLKDISPAAGHEMVQMLDGRNV